MRRRRIDDVNSRITTSFRRDTYAAVQFIGCEPVRVPFDRTLGGALLARPAYAGRRFRYRARCRKEPWIMDPRLAQRTRVPGLLHLLRLQPDRDEPSEARHAGVHTEDRNGGASQAVELRCLYGRDGR